MNFVMSSSTGAVPRNGSDKANWFFNNLAPGQYQVFTHWAAFSNRATNAPYTLYDGANAQATAVVNQTQFPSGVTVAGVTWQSLGAT